MMKTGAFVALLMAMACCSAGHAESEIGMGGAGNVPAKGGQYPPPFDIHLALQQLQWERLWREGLDMLEKNGDEAVTVKVLIQVLNKESSNRQGEVDERIETLVKRLAQSDRPEADAALKRYTVSVNRDLAISAKQQTEEKKNREATGKTRSGASSEKGSGAK